MTVWTATVIQTVNMQLAQKTLPRTWEPTMHRALTAPGNDIALAVDCVQQ